MIDKMVQQNGGFHYTNDMYEFAHMELQKKIKMLREACKEEMERKAGEIKSQCDDECKKIEEKLKRGPYDKKTCEEKEALQQKLEKDLKEINNKYQEQLRDLRETADEDVTIMDAIFKTFSSVFSKIKNWFEK